MSIRPILKTVSRMGDGQACGQQILAIGHLGLCPDDNGIVQSRVCLNGGRGA